LPDGFADVVVVKSQHGELTITLDAITGFLTLLQHWFG
jgi:hypothetical protein